MNGEQYYSVESVVVAVKWDGHNLTEVMSALASSPCDEFQIRVTREGGINCLDYNRSGTWMPVPVGEVVIVSHVEIDTVSEDYFLKEYSKV